MTLREIVKKWDGEKSDETTYIFPNVKKAREAYEEICRELPELRLIHMQDEIHIYK